MGKCFVSLGALLLLVGAVTAEKKSHVGYQVLRVVPQQAGHVDAINQLEIVDGVSLWKAAHHLGTPADVMVAPGALPRITALLTSRGLPWEVFIRDVQESVLKSEAPAAGGAAKDTAFIRQYRSTAEIHNYLDGLAKQHPSICSVESAGQSYEGRDLKIIKIGRNPSAPGIWVDAGIHAREWLSPATILYFIKKLVEDYSTDSESKGLVDKLNWYILPVHNPDGYEWSRKKDRMWRKTRTPGSGTSWSGKPCMGADPNRNWSYKWGTVGASSKPCSDTYRGKQAFSEPCTKRVSEYVLNVKTKLRAHFTFHSYSQLWMTPWGYTTALPKDYKELKALGDKAVAALRKVHGTVYRPVGSTTNTIYAASGNNGDWAKAVAGIKYSYAIELRDKGRYGFLAPASEIIPSGEETWEGVKVVARHVMQGN